jgi:hypothetical protein
VALTLAGGNAFFLCARHIAILPGLMAKENVTFASHAAQSLTTLCR